MQIQRVRSSVFHIFWTFYVPTKNIGKVGEKQSIMSLSMYDRDISPEGLEFNQGLATSIKATKTIEKKVFSFFLFLIKMQKYCILLGVIF